jgi:hypothetical protein
MPEVKYANTLLQSFDSELIDRLHLKSVAFKVGHEIEFPGKPIKHLFFLEEGMASMTTTFKDGSEVEVGMFGYESVIGVSSLMGTKQSLNRVYTQIAGWGYRCRFDAAAAEFGRCGPFQRLALRYVQAQLVQCAQSAVCSTISTSLHACGNVLPFATPTSTCRSRFTICSAVCFFPFAIIRSFLYSLSHENWYIKGRALQVPIMATHGADFQFPNWKFQSTISPCKARTLRFS